MINKTVQYISPSKEIHNVRRKSIVDVQHIKVIRPLIISTDIDDVPCAPYPPPPLSMV